MSLFPQYTHEILSKQVTPLHLRAFKPEPYVGDVLEESKLEASDWSEGEPLEGEDKGRSFRKDN